MTFSEFLKTTCYTPIYAARKVLYVPDSRPAKMAKNLGLTITPSVRKTLVSVAAGKLTVKEAEKKWINNKSDNASPPEQRKCHQHANNKNNNTPTSSHSETVT